MRLANFRSLLISIPASASTSAARTIGVRAVTLLVSMLLLFACTGDKREHTLQWSRAYIVVPAGAAPSVMYMTILNGTDQPDTLLRVTSPLSDQVEMHEEMKHTAESGPPVEMVHMMPVKSIAIAAKGEFHFSPGGHHIMITGPKHPIVAGDSIPITLHFAKAGTMEGKAAVITYSDVDTAVTRVTHTR